MFWAGRFCQLDYLKIMNGFCDEILYGGWTWPKKWVIRFYGDLDSFVDLRSSMMPHDQ